MATIALYAGKLRQMTGLIQETKNAIIDFNSELTSIRTRAMAINRNIVNLDDVISSIQASSRTQEEKIASLDAIDHKIKDFETHAYRIDSNVAILVNQRKDDFYKVYSWLKPGSEKNGWEKFWDGCKRVGQWCKDNWKTIGKIVLAVVIIVAIGIASVLTGGLLAAILVGAFWGALVGGLLGGVMGGVSSAMGGGSFLEGFADGALRGVITGAVTGAACAGLGVLGAIAGKGISCLSALGKAITVTSKVTRALSFGMTGFDMLAMGIGLFDSSNPLFKLNNTLHSNSFYNAFQLSVGAIAIFTAGATSTMVCFVAGTMVLTAVGLVEIENIKAGEKVISTDPETGETAEKSVVETYIRESAKLVHVWIDGEETLVTPDHPYWVPEKGWVSAGELVAGDQLRCPGGELATVQKTELEELDTPVTVYNFQVADFHTYYAGSVCVLVHNAGDSYQRPSGHRNGIRDEVWENNKGTDGIVRDPVTGRPMDSNQPWDMGHRPGYEFRKHQASAAERGITRKQFLNEHNNPSHYRPELPGSNRSRIGESLTDLYLGP